MSITSILDNDILFKIGAFTDNPQVTSLVCKKFGSITEGCFARIRREVIQDPEARIYWLGSVKETFQFVVRELRKTGMKNPVFFCSDLYELIALKLIPFHESYFPMFDAIATGTEGAEELIQKVEQKPLSEQVGFIRKWMLQNYRLLGRVHRLSLSETGLKFLPPEIILCSNLAQLRIAYNALTFLPEWIGAIKKLSSLTVARNQIEHLPESMKDLRYLERLSICGNRIKTLPVALKPMVLNLETFAVDDFVQYEDGSKIQEGHEPDPGNLLRRMMQNAIVYLNLL